LNPLAMIWTVFLDTAPFLLLGLFLAGWLKVLLKTENAVSLLGRPGLRSAIIAALIGVPMPICSCGVLPVSMSLRDKGISREANLSFIISTPETSVDTLAISWGLLGPFMTFCRLVAALFAALFAAVLSIAERTDRKVSADAIPEAAGVNLPDEDEREYLVVGFRGFWESLKSAFSHLLEKQEKETPQDDEPDQTVFPQPKQPKAKETASLDRITADAFHYGFVRVFADISLWLVIGIILAGLIAAFVPDGVLETIPGGRVVTMLLVLIVSVPMYVCAVESTPLAAMLILKGLSPGAALLFLLAGPATNLTTMLLIRGMYGRRFFWLYLSSILIVAFSAGLGLDALLFATGWVITPQAGFGQANGFWILLSHACALILLGLIVHSFIRMNWREKWTMLAIPGRNLKAFFGGSSLKHESGGDRHSRPGRPARRRRVMVAIALMSIAAYFASGIYTIGPGNSGFHIQLGKIVEAEVGPGLHYHLPWPFARVDRYRTEEARKADIGYRTDLAILRELRKNPPTGFGDSWHSFFTNMNTQPEEASYLLGDENQLEAKFSVHFRVKDNHQFHYKHAKNANLVALVAESVMREHMATELIDKTLTTRRAEIEASIMSEAQALLDRYGMGVEILGIHTVDLHPPLAAVEAFREVASAMEERETLIHNAYAARESDVPRARGEAEKLRENAAASAKETTELSAGKAESFKAQAEAFGDFKETTRLRMDLEAEERSLTDLRKLIVPLEMRGRVRLWSSNNNNDYARLSREGSN
jgi:uncharacterized membrane protein YraQ (UPF0718 family)/regulator of protease activity HflC (stomatin/prohibitin superfamily)